MLFLISLLFLFSLLVQIILSIDILIYQPINEQIINLSEIECYYNHRLISSELIRITFLGTYLSPFPASHCIDGLYSTFCHNGRYDSNNDMLIVNDINNDNKLLIQTLYDINIDKVILRNRKSNKERILGAIITISDQNKIIFNTTINDIQETYVFHINDNIIYYSNISFYRDLYFSSECNRPETNYISTVLSSLDNIYLSTFNEPTTIDNNYFKNVISSTYRSNQSKYIHLVRQQFTKESAVTLVITSCNRTELLFQTIRSFVRYNTYPIARCIIVEDSSLIEGSYDSEIQSFVPFPVHIIYNKVNIGQIASIDKAYSLVDTPYIFHCEDDWEFYRSGFIEDSLIILEEDPTVSMVAIRAHHDLNGQGYEQAYSTKIDTTAAINTNSNINKGETKVILKNYYYLQQNYLGIYSGYGLHPGLRRTLDYLKEKPLFPNPDFRKGMELLDWVPRAHEIDVVHMYNKFNIRGALTLNKEGYVRHLGDNDHIWENNVRTTWDN